MWYLVLLAVGIIIGLVIGIKLDGPETVINDNTTIGKMKQRGTGNAADVSIDPEVAELLKQPMTSDERKEARLLKRLSRIQQREREEKKAAE